MSIPGVILFGLFGLVVGLVARALMPGRQSMGLVITAALGIAGSVIGGLVYTVVTAGRVDMFEPLGFIGSVIGALALLGFYSASTRGRQLRS